MDGASRPARRRLASTPFPLPGTASGDPDPHRSLAERKCCGRGTATGQKGSSGGRRNGSQAAGLHHHPPEGVQKIGPGVDGAKRSLVEQSDLLGLGLAEAGSEYDQRGLDLDRGYGGHGGHRMQARCRRRGPLGSQVGSHSRWIAADGCGRGWNQKPFVPGSRTERSRTVTDSEEYGWTSTLKR